MLPLRHRAPLFYHCTLVCFKNIKKFLLTSYIMFVYALGSEPGRFFSPDIFENIITNPGKYYIFGYTRLNKSLNFLEYKKYARNVNNEQLMNITSRDIHRFFF